MHGQHTQRWKKIEYGKGGFFNLKSSKTRVIAMHEEQLPAIQGQL